MKEVATYLVRSWCFNLRLAHEHYKKVIPENKIIIRVGETHNILVKYLRDIDLETVETVNISTKDLEDTLLFFKELNESLLISERRGHLPRRLMVTWAEVYNALNDIEDKFVFGNFLCARDDDKLIK